MLCGHAFLKTAPWPTAGTITSVEFGSWPATYFAQRSPVSASNVPPRTSVGSGPLAGARIEAGAVGTFHALQAPSPRNVNPGDCFRTDFGSPGKLSRP